MKKKLITKILKFKIKAKQIRMYYMKMLEINYNILKNKKNLKIK